MQYIDLIEIVHVVKAVVIVTSVRLDLRTFFMSVLFFVLTCPVNGG